MNDELTPTQRAELAATLDRLPTPDGPGAEALLRAPPPRSRAPLIAVVVAAAAALILVVLPDDSARNKGIGEASAAPTVRLMAVAEGPSGVRPLPDGATVAPDEWVVFSAESSTAGTLSLTDDTGTPLAPAWQVDGPGATFLGGGAPLAFRPDDGEPLGARQYGVQLCPLDAADCVTAALTLAWSEP